MDKAYVLTGTLQDRQWVKLDEPLPMAAERVRNTVQALVEPPRTRSYAETLAEIHARLTANGHVPPTREEVSGRIAEERDSWD